jgi:uncharacterized protein
VANLQRNCLSNCAQRDSIPLMLRVLWLLVLVSMLAMAPAMAQDAAKPADAPLMGSDAVAPQEPQPTAPQAIAAPAQQTTLAATPAFGGEDGVYRILVIGDALAGGLGNGMARMSVDDTRFEIANRFNEFASLMRPGNYDWPEAVSKIAAVKPYDAAVILMGINDRQDWRNGNIRYAFNTPQWIAAYEQQLDRLLDSVKAGGMKIYWVAMPPFGDSGFENDMQALAAIQKKRVEAKGGVVLDVRASLFGPDGKYTDRGLDEVGVDRRIRESDGITFFKQGNNRFGILVMAALRAAEHVPDIDGTPPAVAAAPSETPVAIPPQEQASVQPTAPADPGTPVFGQQGLDGGDISFDASSVEEAKPAPAAVPSATPIVPKVLAAAAGSKSEQLLVHGSVTEAPAGRFDDFSYTPPASTN